MSDKTNKAIIAVIVLAIIAAGWYFFLRKKNEPVEVQRTGPTQTKKTLVTPQPPLSQAPVAEKKTIIYTDTGYSPSSLTIKKGETVIFKNQSSRSMWPASAFHPTHKEYPTTGGCLGSTFDACKGVQPGGSWSFTFNFAGGWKYHDHLSPTNFGAILVK